MVRLELVYLHAATQQNRSTTYSTHARVRGPVIVSADDVLLRSLAILYWLLPMYRSLSEVPPAIEEWMMGGLERMETQGGIQAPKPTTPGGAPSVMRRAARSNGGDPSEHTGVASRRLHSTI